MFFAKEYHNKVIIQLLLYIFILHEQKCIGSYWTDCKLFMNHKTMKVLVQQNLSSAISELYSHISAVFMFQTPVYFTADITNHNYHNLRSDLSCHDQMFS